MVAAVTVAAAQVYTPTSPMTCMTARKLEANEICTDLLG